MRPDLQAAVDEEIALADDAGARAVDAWVQPLFSGTGTNVTVSPVFDGNTLVVTFTDYYDAAEQIVAFERGVGARGWYISNMPDEFAEGELEYTLQSLACSPVTIPAHIYQVTTPGRAERILNEGIKLARGGASRAHGHSYPPRAYFFKEPLVDPGNLVLGDLGVGSDYAVLEVDTADVPYLKLCADRHYDVTDPDDWFAAYAERTIPAKAVRRMR